ncbi:hypothetical protein ACFL0H_15995, partial [Thermodesulfobacteriota bacterium]
MSKSVAIFVALALFFISHSGWAQLSPKQEKRLNELEASEKALKAWEENRSEQEEKLMEMDSRMRAQTARQTRKQDFKAFLSNGSEGRFQAVRMDSNAIFILD